MYFTSATLLRKEDKLVLEVYCRRNGCAREDKSVFHCSFSENVENYIIDTFRRQGNYYATQSPSNVHRSITRSLRILTASTISAPLMTELGDTKYKGITHGEGNCIIICAMHSHRRFFVSTNRRSRLRSAYIPNNIEMYDIIRQECIRSRPFANRTRRRMNRVTETLFNRKPEKFERLSCSDWFWIPNANRRDVSGVKAGIELEFSRVTDIEGDPEYMAVKTDGSLPSCGREVVTRPDNVDEHIKNISEWLDYNNRNLEVDESCGMHIHVDKRHFPKDALTVLIDRVYDIKNRVKYCKVAGREANDYWTLRRQNTRYTAINTEPDNTVEFRLFSGTKSKHKIKRRLQWIKAVVNYANNPKNTTKVKEARLQKEELERKEKAERYSRLFSDINNLIGGRINVTQEFQYEQISNYCDLPRSISCVIGYAIRDSGLLDISIADGYLVFFSAIEGVVWMYSAGVCRGCRVNKEIIYLVKNQEGDQFFRYMPHFNNTDWEEYYRQHKQETV